MDNINDTMDCIVAKEQSHQEQLLELYWHIKDDIANTTKSIAEIRKNYDISTHVLRGIKAISTEYQSLERLKADYRRSKYKQAKLFVRSLYWNKRGLRYHRNKMPGYVPLSRLFESATATNDLDYRLRLAEYLRGVIDRFSPMPVEVGERTYLKYHSCCGCGTEDIPPKGMFLFDYEGMPVPLCNDCWINKTVDDERVFDLMLDYIKRVEFTNNILTGVM